MQKECYKKVEIADDCNMELTYYLLTDSVREEYCDLKVYGAEIQKNCPLDGETENKAIKNLFFRRSEAENFLEKLARNRVTPMGLISAVSEHIGEQLQLLSCE